MKNRSRGFTLMELMVVLALAAVILGIGVPNFRDFQRNNRLTVAANDTLGIILTGRGEALRRQIPVSLCTSPAPNDANPTCGGGTGWIAFQDTNGNCVKDPGDTVVSNISIDSDVSAVTNTTCMSFGTNGFKSFIAGQPNNAHMLYCDDRGNTPRNTGGTDSHARGIEVLPTGRGAVIKSVAELALWDGGSEGVACP